jgi:hypothetical protein
MFGRRRRATAVRWRSTADELDRHAQETRRYALHGSP